MAIPDATYIGDIVAFGFAFSPKDFTQCNGAEIAIAQNQAQYSLLGTAFGGNGSTTYALPDLRSRAPIGFYTGVTSHGLTMYVRGQTVGSQFTTLTKTELPSHTHTATFSPNGAEELTGSFIVKSGGGRVIHTVGG